MSSLALLAMGYRFPERSREMSPAETKLWLILLKTDAASYRQWR